MFAAAAVDGADTLDPFCVAVMRIFCIKIS